MSVMNESYFLPQTLRSVINQRNSIIGEDDTFFIRTFPYEKRIAMLNNYQASKLASGFVPGIHTNLLNAKIISAIHKKLVNKICSNVEIEGEPDKDISVVLNSVKKFSKTIKELTSYCLSRGEACLSIDNELNLSVYPLARYSLQFDNNANLIEAHLYKQLFDGSTKYIKYVLVEHRFSKGDKFYYEYNVIRFEFHKLDNFDEDLVRYKLNKEDLPPKIIEALDGVEINKPIEIKKLGVYLVKNTEINLLNPFSNIGESQYLDVYDDSVALDTTFTYKEVDKYLGRGRVLMPSLQQAIPQSIQISADGKIAKKVPYSKNNNFDYTFMQPYENLNAMNNSQPQSMQFNLRTTEWLADKNDLVVEICTKCGLSIFDYNPTFSTGARTAREIDELSDITAQTVNEKRSYLTLAINDLLRDICEILGRNDLSLFIKWDKSTIVNTASNTELVINKYQQGLISRRTALKDLNPNWNDAEIDAELERINSETDNKNADVVFKNF